MTDTPLYQQVEALEDLVERRQARIDELAAERSGLLSGTATLRRELSEAREREEARNAHAGRLGGQLREATDKLNTFSQTINELERKLDKQEPYLPSTHELAARNQRQAVMITELNEALGNRELELAELRQAVVELKVSTNEDRCEASQPEPDSPYVREMALRLSIDVTALAGGASATAILAQARSFETYLSTPTEKETR